MSDKPQVTSYLARQSPVRPAYPEQRPEVVYHQYQQFRYEQNDQLHQQPPQLDPRHAFYQFHQPLQRHQSPQPVSPDPYLAALPDSFMQNGSSTPKCHCQVHRHQQFLPSTPSSSLLSFSDSSASFSSDLSQAAAPNTCNPTPASSQQAVQRLSDDRRRLRLAQREEVQVKRLIADLDSRLRLANSGRLGGVKDTELLTLQRMSAESVLRTVQMYVAAKSADLAAKASATAGPGLSADKCGHSASDSSDTDNCGLLDY